MQTKQGFVVYQNLSNKKLKSLKKKIVFMENFITFQIKKWFIMILHGNMNLVMIMKML